MSTFGVPVYPSQLDAFKEKTDLLADKIKQALNIKVSKFKRYDYLASALGHNGHDRLIANAKRIAQSDPREPLQIFADPVNCRKIADVYKTQYNNEVAEVVSELCKELGVDETDLPGTSGDIIQTELVPAIRIDSSAAPAHIAKVFFEHPDVRAFDFDNKRVDIKFSNIYHKAHVELGKEGWSIKASFDAWGCEEIPIDVLVKWQKFNRWLSQFLPTDRIHLAQRTKNQRWQIEQSQVNPDTSLLEELNKLSKEEDRLLFNLLAESNSSLNPKPMTAGERIAGRRRGREFKGLYEQVDAVIKTDIQPEAGEEYDLHLLAENIYHQLENSWSFSSLDLAGFILDNSGKLGISLYVAGSTRQGKRLASENYYFEGPVSRMHFETKGKPLTFDPINQDTDYSKYILGAGPASWPPKTLPSEVIKANLTGEQPTPGINDIGSSLVVEDHDHFLALGMELTQLYNEIEFPCSEEGEAADRRRIAELEHALETYKKSR